MEKTNIVAKPRPSDPPVCKKCGRARKGCTINYCSKVDKKKPHPPISLSAALKDEHCKICGKCGKKYNWLAEKNGCPVCNKGSFKDWFDQYCCYESDIRKKDAKTACYIGWISSYDEKLDQKDARIKELDEKLFELGNKHIKVVRKYINQLKEANDIISYCDVGESEIDEIWADKDKRMSLRVLRAISKKAREYQKKYPKE